MEMCPGMVISNDLWALPWTLESSLVHCCCRVVLALGKVSYHLRKKLSHATGEDKIHGFQVSFFQHQVYFIILLRMWLASSFLHPFSKSGVFFVNSNHTPHFSHCPHHFLPTQCYTISNIQNFLQGLNIKQHSGALNSELHFRVEAVRERDNLMVCFKMSYLNLQF